MNAVFKNWKTSLAGLLSTITALAAGGIFAPNNGIISTKAAAILALVAGAARIILGLLQTDATQPGVAAPTPLLPATPTVPPTAPPPVQPAQPAK